MWLMSFFFAHNYAASKNRDEGKNGRESNSGFKGRAFQIIDWFIAT